MAGFIGQSLVGVGAFGITVRVPLVQELVGMVVGYALTLALMYGMALVASALAPKFQGQAHVPSAFKLLAYGATAGMVGGVFSLLPSLAMLGLVAALYSIYLMYQGAPVLMKVPYEKAMGYTAALVACAVVLGLVVGGASALFMPRAGLGSWRAAARFRGWQREHQRAGHADQDRHRQGRGRRAPHRAGPGARRHARGWQGHGRGAGRRLGRAGRGADCGGNLEGPDARHAGRHAAHIGPDARTEGMAGMQFSSVTAQFSEGDRMIEARVLVHRWPAMPMLAMAAWARGTVDRETADEAERACTRRTASPTKRNTARMAASRALPCCCPTACCWTPMAMCRCRT